MALATQKYDVTLAGSGFVLMEESYRKRAQQPFVPRFSTGDPGLGDLSFWQFIAQEAWSGGAGQEIFETVTKYAETGGWSLLRGAPALSGGNEDTGVALTSPESSPVNPGFSHLVLPFGKTGSVKPSLVFSAVRDDVANYAAGALTTVRTATDTLIGIAQVTSFGACIWHREATTTLGSILCATCTDPNGSLERIYFYGSDFSTLGNITTIAKPRIVVPINGEKLAVFSDPGYCTAVEVFTLNNNAYTISAQLKGYFSGMGNVLLPHYAFDSNTTLYVASSTFPGGSVPADSDHIGSALALLTSTDLLGSVGPRASEIVNYPDLLIGGIASINGTVYLFGSRVYRVHASDSSKREYRNVVVKFPNTTIWESRKIQTDAAHAGVIRAVHQVNRSEVLFISQPSISGYASIMRLLPNDVVEEVGALPGNSSDTSKWTAVGRAGSSFYAWDSAVDQLWRLKLDSSLTTKETANTRILETSAYGGNTPLIDKTPYGVTVELSSAIDSGETLTVQVNGTTIGTMTNADGTSKEIIITSDLTAASFIIKLTMPGTALWAGRVLKTSVRYIPTQFKKFAWSFGIRADRNLRLGDGSMETLTGAQIFDNVQTAWESNTPITMVDVDGTSYTVIITDLDQRRGLLDRDSNKEESFALLEVLQI